MARTIVPKFESSKPLKVDLPADLKKRLDVVIALAGESQKDYITQLVLRAVEADERRRSKKEAVA